MNKLHDLLRSSQQHPAAPHPKSKYLPVNVPREISSRFVSCKLVLAAGVLLLVPGAWAKPGSLQFNRDIRPLLSDNCFQCHGPDEEARKSELRLDGREQALQPAKSGKVAVAPRHPGRSELVRRIFATDRDDLMPPPESNKQLSTAQKDLLRRWIAEGAEYQPHWAFLLPRKSELPEVKKKDWARNPIDRFVLAGLEQESLAPSPEAARSVLMRRATLDLTGLPPTPAELEAFLKDQSPDACAHLVDRLMASRDYAERRAQDWLDLARYADTRGFADDKTRNIWPYRDWVVRALHRNMPFDQFTVEQLAGDMLPGATDEQRLATGFHRNAPQARGQTYPVEEYRLKGVTDRVNTTGRVWLGLTMDCAECHDHKFDPISQRDYYSLFAIFNNTEHQGKGFGQGGPTMKYRYRPAGSKGKFEAERARLETELAVARKGLPPPRPLGEDGLLGNWDGPHVAADAGKFSVTGDLTITARIRTKQPVANIASKYDWRGKQRSYVFGIGGEGDKNGVPGHLFFWVSSQTDPYQGVEIHGSRAVNDGRNHDVAIVFKADKAVRLFVDGIEDNAARVIGKVPGSIAVSDRRLAIGAGYNATPEATAYRFEGSLTGVRLYGRALGAELSGGRGGAKVQQLQAALHKLEQEQGAGAGEVSAVPVMKERAKPRDTFIHVRGNFLSRGDKVSPAAPTVLASPGELQPQNRLEFARWLVNGNNPLVARVVVNRIWQTYFGHGLVRTPDDFGAQGAAPTHPGLLDWLACEFMSSGWDMKHLNRLIVTSSTYRQSARTSPELQRRDPNNLLLARMPRVRLPAEQIRDQALAISGLLKPVAGGPSVFPPQPQGYWEERDLPGKWTASKGDELHRKSLYIYWRRMALHPTLELLDAPGRAVCAVRRNTSNLPTQALVTLNDPIFVEAARHLARRVVNEIPADESGRVDFSFRLCLGRPPSVEERARFLAFLKDRTTRYAGDQSATRKLTGSDDPTLAAWTSVATILLNLDETITRP